MLKGSFYTVITSRLQAPGILEVTIKLNSEHRVFSGHFPGMPVVPGVCMLLIFKELLQPTVNLELNLAEASNIKFLSVLDPGVHPVVDIRINFEDSNTGILVKEASISFDAISFIKLQHAKYYPHKRVAPSPASTSDR